MSQASDKVRMGTFKGQDPGHWSAILGYDQALSIQFVQYGWAFFFEVSGFYGIHGTRPLTSLALFAVS